ncbi:hypothetical protein LEP1GSC058_0323 [Leptospira fainei serovar Hurstbridge str. BUT 6]|uniref:Uncharacterized protein n=1 Tax=Leptospira fainei serovar Hurstbridge str. BUT 6 TaxID=1193011 RepID=S3V336_9LEPT|nr:hypothetical protein LEP1GSC058_0323 [Leptospira fainei serovar Hurstbridge str. BUT 6]
MMNKFHIVVLFNESLGIIPLLYLFHGAEKDINRKSISNLVFGIKYLNLKNKKEIERKNVLSDRIERPNR